MPTPSLDQRRLILLRHAKSSWSEPTLADYERPLNKRGRRDAPEMADRLRRRGPRPDRVVTSGARRTRQTADALVDALGLTAGQVEHDRDLYLADAERLLRFVHALDDRLQTVVVVAHNPGLTELVRRLGRTDLDNLPTCGYADFAFDCPSWGLVDVECARMLRLDYPKNRD